MRPYLATVLVLIAPSSLLPLSPPGLEGTWEGEFQASRAPIFMTLHLEGEAWGWSGTVEILGRTVPLQEVYVEGHELRGVIVPGDDGVSLEVSLFAGGLVGEVREGDRRFPVSMSRVPDYPAPEDRREAWHQDLDALSNRFLTFDRSFSPGERKLFLERVDEIRQNLDGLTDSEVIMAMAGAVALSENAHSRLYLLRNRTEFGRFPIRLWWFQDGLRVVRATKDHQDLIGCRVDRIGIWSTRLVRDRVSGAFAGNPSWRDYMSVYFMTSPEALQGTGVLPDSEEASFGLSECPVGTIARRLEALPLEPHSGAVEAWWDLAPLRNPEGWVHALDGREALPLYLTRPDRHYWHSYDEPSGLLYVQYSRATEMADESLEAFEREVTEALDREEVKGFVLDLRFNTGGNLDLAASLMSVLEKRTRGIPRFVVVGRSTFSAGITHAATWAQAGGITLVGEPVGDDMDTWSEGGNVTLPNSGLVAHFANAYHSYSEEPCPDTVPCYLDLSAPSLRPDLPASPTWEEYRSGRDPAWEEILRMVGSDRDPDPS
jgi:hypothetical protein